ncbi:MAG: lysine biosynthesis protein LysW [Candidatus Nitrosocaldaceae archaeon]|nr:MAG: lysine biosynthesis protein LysW [Candidatus Nitrosocaldaceae archaeon]
MKKVNCPECDAEIKVPDDAIEGEIITCPDCGANYEIAEINDEVKIVEAESVGEDWGE